MNETRRSEDEHEDDDEDEELSTNDVRYLIGAVAGEVFRFLRPPDGLDEASFYAAARELMRVAAFYIRTIERRLGREISPDSFAKIGHSAADEILHAANFQSFSDRYFEKLFDPDPPVPYEQFDVEKDVIDYLSVQEEPRTEAQVSSFAVERNGERFGRSDNSLNSAVSWHCYMTLKRLSRRKQVRRDRDAYRQKGVSPRETDRYVWIGGVPDVVGAGGEPAISPAVKISPTEKPETPEAPVLVPEETIGEGGELVYVYFNEAERKLAEHEGRNWWPCKVGFTTSSLTARVFGQRPHTAIGRLPVVGLIIQTNEGRALERALHAALKSATSHMDDAVGSEWFETSPRKIKEWYLAHRTAVEALQRALARS